MLLEQVRLELELPELELLKLGQLGQVQLKLGQQLQVMAWRPQQAWQPVQVQPL